VPPPPPSSWVVDPKGPGGNMVIFRENTEDIYAGIEFAANSVASGELFEWLQVRVNPPPTDPSGNVVLGLISSFPVVFKRYFIYQSLCAVGGQKNSHQRWSK